MAKGSGIKGTLVTCGDKNCYGGSDGGSGGDNGVGGSSSDNNSGSYYKS